VCSASARLKCFFLFWMLIMTPTWCWVPFWHGCRSREWFFSVFFVFRLCSSSFLTISRLILHFEK
jgi:hypothetical protein